MRAISVRTPSGKKKRVVPPPHITPQILSTMTETTQLQMFGGTYRQRQDRSIHGKAVYR